MPSTARQALVETIWFGQEPFAGFPVGLYQTDMQGWQSQHPFLSDSVALLRPKVIVEVGVWKGGSAITMASGLKEGRVDGVLVAVDTWLGAWDHWLNRQWFDHLAFETGMPQLYRKFVQNVFASDVQDYVLPLPIDSSNAAIVMKNRGVSIDLLHIDAAHDYVSVQNDLRMWWPLVKPGGILLGDDYTHDGAWPEVRKAFDDFFGVLGMEVTEHHGRKCRIVKS